MNAIIQALQSVRDVYINFPKQYNLSQEELRKVESEIQDILHVIELTNFNACNGYKWAKELQRLRKARRQLKDQIEMLEPIKELITFPKPTEKNVGKIIGDVKSIEQKHKVRTYRMRVRAELQEMI